MKAGTLTHRKREIHYHFIETVNSVSAPILLLGGVLQNRKSWKSYIQDLTPTNSVLVVDLPGIGDGKVLDASVGFDFLADCVFKVVDHLRIPKVNIFSTSYSSIIAYEFSAKYTQLVDQLIISSSMAFLPDQQRMVMLDCIEALKKKDLPAFYQVFIDGVCNSSKEVYNYDLSRKVIGMLVNTLSNDEISQFIENTYRVLNYTIPEVHPAKIALTPLIFTGEYDNFTPPHLCKGIGEYYTSSYFGTIDNYDHLFHIGNRQAIVKSILPFFQDQSIPGFCKQYASVTELYAGIGQLKKKKEKETNPVIPAAHVPIHTDGYYLRGAV